MTDEDIKYLASCLAKIKPDQLAALPAVYKAALRGANTAMRAAQREELQLGMAAFEEIIETLRGGR